MEIERNLTKEQILELYLNKIYLGKRAYGFGSAAFVYFGKRLDKINIAEAAMLAGLPKALLNLIPTRITKGLLSVKDMFLIECTSLVRLLSQNIKKITIAS